MVGYLSVGDGRQPGLLPSLELRWRGFLQRLEAVLGQRFHDRFGS